MDDLISRQAAIDYCEALMEAERVQQTDDWGYGRERYNQTEAIQHYIENMPSAQPEIIHCRDCKYLLPKGTFCGKDMCCLRGMAHYHNIDVDTDYCSWVERMEDGEN